MSETGEYVRQEEPPFFGDDDLPGTPPTTNGTDTPQAPKGPRPHPSEQEVVGALLKSRPWSEVRDIVCDEDYNSPKHRLIIPAIRELADAGEPHDPVTVAHLLEGRDHLDAAGGREYLIKLVTNTVTEANIVAHAVAVARAALTQRMRLPASHRDAEGIAQLERDIAKWKALDAPAMPPAPTVELLTFTPEQVLAEIEPEIELLPGIPSDAYTLMPGALSTYKTTLLLYLLVWKATGWDVLGLDDRGGGVTIGKAVLVTYEDSDARLFKKLQRVIQHGYQVIARRWGERDAREFVARAAQNIHRIGCSGKVERGLVHRVGGIITPNYAFLDPLAERLRKLAPDGALIGLDPLRLAIVGSQNDDDGADVVVHTLNGFASAIPGSGLIASSHTTKGTATNGANPDAGYAGASYATSGSALYSQHARSNFFLARLTEQDARKLFDPQEVTAEDVRKQRVVSLAHGRLSHGEERDTVYLLMRAGTLQRVGPRPDRSAADLIREEAPHVIAAIERLQVAGIRVSHQALESDTGLLRALGSTRQRLRASLRLLEQNEYIATTGTTTNRALKITPKGQAVAPQQPPPPKDRTP